MKKYYSDTFSVGGYKWYILFFICEIVICAIEVLQLVVDLSWLVSSGGYQFFQRETTWTTCQCIWMLQTLQRCRTGGVDMHSSAWLWLIRSIKSIQYERVITFLLSENLFIFHYSFNMQKNDVFSFLVLVVACFREIFSSQYQMKTSTQKIYLVVEIFSPFFPHFLKHGQLAFMCFFPTFHN